MEVVREPRARSHDREGTWAASWVDSERSAMRASAALCARRQKEYEASASRGAEGGEGIETRSDSDEGATPHPPRIARTKKAPGRGVKRTSDPKEVIEID